jgi:hypothetical protein
LQPITTPLLALLKIKVFIVLLYFLSSLILHPYTQFKLNLSLIRDLGYTYTPSDGKSKMRGDSDDTEGIEMMAKELGGTETARIRAKMIF